MRRRLFTDKVLQITSIVQEFLRELREVFTEPQDDLGVRHAGAAAVWRGSWAPPPQVAMLRRPAAQAREPAADAEAGQVPVAPVRVKTRAKRTPAKKAASKLKEAPAPVAAEAPSPAQAANAEAPAKKEPAVPEAPAKAVPSAPTALAPDAQPVLLSPRPAPPAVPGAAAPPARCTGTVLIFRDKGQAYCQLHGSLPDPIWQAFQAALRQHGRAPTAGKQTGWLYAVGDGLAFQDTLAAAGVPFGRWEPEQGLAPHLFDTLLLLRSVAWAQGGDLVVTMPQKQLVVAYKRTERCLRINLTALEELGWVRRERHRVRLLRPGASGQRISRSGPGGSADPIPAEPEIRSRSSSVSSPDLFSARGSSPVPVGTDAPAAAAPAAPDTRRGPGPSAAGQDAPLGAQDPLGASSPAAAAPAAPDARFGPAAPAAPLRAAGPSAVAADPPRDPVGADATAAAAPAAPDTRRGPGPSAAGLDPDAVAATPASAVPSAAPSELHFPWRPACAAAAPPAAGDQGAGPGPSATGHAAPPRGPDPAALDAQPALWLKARKLLQQERDHTTFLWSKLLVCVSAEGGVLRLAAQQPALERPPAHRQAVALCRAAARAAGRGAWHIEWVAWRDLPAPLRPQPEAEVSHAG